MILTLQLLLAVYVLICIGVYGFQEKLIFFPDTLSPQYRFSFDQSFEEIRFPAGESGMLHGLLFRSAQAKGLVFYLHGNAGAVNSWGAVAGRYTALGYDVFLPDYPGYGKSEGSIRSQQQLLAAVQAAYDEMKKRYAEHGIVVLGYSIGSGPAAWLASANRPAQLILQAPYYSLTDIMRRTYPFLPAFLLKYPLRTHEYLRHCTMPVVLFHGNRDEVIPLGSALKLKEGLKAGDTLIVLEGQGHNGITDNPHYVQALSRILP
ncbi:MAG TPA: alpha/beta fold hydrolase [Chitinophagaceae bacterium]|jgi:hypothetical protein|nr:alpha/beta fold hydrolase [Chitinophagaceae bacterium]